MIGPKPSTLSSPSRSARPPLRALAGFGVAFALALGCGGGPKAKNENRADPPRKVRVATAERGELPRIVLATGTLAADLRSELAFKVSGRIDRIAVDLGSRVAAGQVLARLSPNDFAHRAAQAEAALAQARARVGLDPRGGALVEDLAGAEDDAAAAFDPESTSTVRQARAQLDQARANRDRARALAAQQLLAPADLEGVEASYAVAEARYEESIEEALTRLAVLAERSAGLDLARQQLADSELRAPFAGAIEERRAADGEYVAAGTPVLLLVRTHPLRLRLAVPEREAALVRAGLPVKVSIEGVRVEGRVARVAPAIAESSRTLAIEAEIPNRDGALRAGSFARAQIEVRAAESAVLVPAAAIVSFAGVDKVIGVADGKAVERRVRLGRQSGDRVEVIAGIEAGESVILEPGSLTEGQAVEVGR